MNSQTAASQWMPKFFGKPDAATYTASSVRALDYARTNGNLAFYAVGRKIVFARADLDAWMTRFRVDVEEVGA